MLRRCANEIATLRETIDHLAPKAEAYNAIVQILGMAPRGNGIGKGEDLRWRLLKRIEEIERVAMQPVSDKNEDEENQR